MGANLFGEIVAGIGFEPAAHGQPFGRLVPVPTVLVSQDHFNDVVAKAAERRDKFWQREKVGDRVGQTALGNRFGRRQLPPERLADEDDAAGTQALRQQFDGAGDAAGDPGGADAGGDIDLLVGDVAGGIAVDEANFIGDAEF